ncbi:GNAT family N-acetyltransferase [Aquabacter spiritensis]|uniref:Acetyltransferase (GNAT) family protein n=1 Tax=Aquabacter spiritensis TaxID=933073 RepID=A0A4R3LZM3_9HYPH|nr:GNAT family N-acetyltransferase [Aquabacter spiritensis]TCT05913.1 acetyltransferase (GNAT) family protein [Aquabacter spiritensis]
MGQDEAETEARWTPVVASRADLPAIHALYETIWGPGRSRAYLDWKLFGAPFDPLPPVIALDGTRCVGVYAALATPLVLDGAKVMGCQSVDTMTHPDFRRQNMSVTLAKVCYAAAEARGFKLVYGMPNENSYPMFTKKLGWTHADEVQRWVRPLAAPARLPGLLARPVSALMTGYARAGRDPQAQVRRVEASTRFVVPAGPPPAARCHVDKSPAWFAWRYAAEPDGAYEQMIFGDPDAPDALIVFEEIREAGAAPVLLVQEWLAVTAKHRLRAIKALAALAAARGCASVVVYTNDPQAGVLLRGALFFPRGGMPLGVAGFGPRADAAPLGKGELVVLGGDKD